MASEPSGHSLQLSALGHEDSLRLDGARFDESQDALEGAAYAPPQASASSKDSKGKVFPAPSRLGRIRRRISAPQ